MDKIVAHLYQPGSSLPPIHPWDTPNASNTKSHWTLEELHRIMGCQHFQNYNHLICLPKMGSKLTTKNFQFHLELTPLPQKLHTKSTLTIKVLSILTLFITTLPLVIVPWLVASNMP
jgi:hypothetical protein